MSRSHHHHHHHHHHSLNGSQTVLTVTFNSYGDRQISTPTKSIPLNQSTKNSAQLIMSARGLSIPNLVQIHPLTASGQKLFLYLFSQARAQVRFVDGFLHAIAQKTWNHARMCLLGVWTMCPQILKVKLPKNWNFGGVNRTFKPERQKFQTLITWNLLIGSWRNFYGEYAPRVCLSGWSHGSPNKSKMAAAAVSPPRQFRDWYQHLQSQTFEATWGYFQFQTSTSTRFIIKYL